jgi:hypothetical protein
VVAIPLGSELVLMARAGPMVMERVADAVWGFGEELSVALTVKVKEPVVVGVPAIAPVDARVSPPGSDPELKLHE